MAKKFPTTFYVHMERDNVAEEEYPVANESLAAVAPPDAGGKRLIGVYRLVEVAELSVETKLTKRIRK